MKLTGGFLLFALAFSGGALAAQGDGTLTIIITGEQMGRMAPCGCTKDRIGGLARRASVIDQVRKSSHGEVVVLDNGALVLDGGRQQEIKYEFTALAMEEMGYDALAVGLRDLRMGLSVLEARAVGSAFAILLGNLSTGEGAFVFERSHLVELPSGRKVGVFALLGETFRTELAMMAPDVELLDPVETARRMTTGLKERADFVVLLSHAPIEETRGIVERVAGIDVAVTGYLLEKPLESAEKVGETLIVGTGLYGKWIVRLDFDFDATGKVAQSRYSRLFLSGDIPEDEEIVQLLADYRAQIAEERLLERVHRAPMGDLAYLGTSACLRCHRRQFKKWETVRHSHALRTLVEERADKDPECVRCHVVGLEEEGGFRSPELTPDLANMGCEMCHGAGNKHARNVLAPYANADEARCRRCHDPENSPEFDYAKYFPKIDHRNATLREARE